MKRPKCNLKWAKDLSIHSQKKIPEWPVKHIKKGWTLMVPEQVQIDNAIPLIPIKMAKTEKKKKHQEGTTGRFTHTLSAGF